MKHLHFPVEKELLDQIPKRLADLKRMRFVQREISAPTRTFQVGEYVSLGNLDDAMVAATLENGKYLALTYTQKVKSRYRSDVGFKRELSVWPWFEVFPLTNIEEYEFSRESHVGNMSQSGLNTLIYRACNEEFRDNPDYQRGYVWTLGDKRRYIGSILNGLDIGKFVLVKFPYPDCEYEVLDGKQRLNAIKDYVLGHFTYNDRYFHQLGYKDRFVFKNRMVQFIELDAKRFTKADLLRLFLELNVAGVPQTEEHLNKVKGLLKVELEKVKQHESKNI